MNPVGKLIYKAVKTGGQKVLNKAMEWNAKRAHNTGKGMSFEPQGIWNQAKNRIQKKQIEKRYADQLKKSDSKVGREWIVETKESTNSMTLTRKRKAKF